MTRIRFKGFADDSEVSLSAMADGVAKGPVTISAWRQPVGGQADVGTMTITVRRSPGLRFAPEGIHLEAEVQGATGLPNLNPDGTAIDGMNRDGTTNANALYTYYDPQFHELEFFWETSQTGTFPLLTRHPTWLRAKNIGHGKHIAHVFETAGAHWVRCSVYRTDYSGGTQTSVLVARKTEQITVASLEDAIPEADRVYVSNITNDPDFASLPAASAKRVPTNNSGSLWSPLSADAQQGTTPKAFFLKRGQDFNIGGGGFGNLGSKYWGAWGTGADPILRTKGGADQVNGAGLGVDVTLIGTGSAKDETQTLTVEGLDIVGEWDPVTETVDDPTTPVRGTFGIRMSNNAWITAVRCRARGHDVTFSSIASVSVQDAASSSFILWGCESTDFRDYGAFFSDDNWGVMFGIMGNLFMNDPAAASNFGIQGKVDDRNTHAPFRSSAFWRSYVAQNDAVSRQGWSGPGAQPCFRLMNEGWGYYPTGFAEPPKLVFWGNMTENGAGGVVGIAGLNHPELGLVRSPYPVNALLKQNIMLTGWSNAEGMTINFGGTTVIENVLIRGTVNEVGIDTATQTVSFTTNSSNLAGFNPMDQRPNSDTSQNREHPIRRVGNTVIDRLPYTVEENSVGFQSLDNVGSESDNPFLGHKEDRDNVHYVLSGSFADTSAGPMELALAIPNRLTRGPALDWDGTRNHQIYDTLNGDGTGASLVAAPGDLDLLRPASGAAVIGTATGPLGRLDLLGNERPANASAGALEPSA